MRVPIAAPFGEPKHIPAGDQSERTKQGASIEFRLSAFCLPRKVLKEMLAEPGSVVAMLIIVTILTVSIAPILFRTISFWEIWFLSFLGWPIFSSLLVLPFSLFEVRREKTVILTSYGVSRYEGKKQIELSWPAHLMILNWSGDVLLKTWASGVFIPREAFASREEAREFVQIARQLHKTGGGAWREEWKGKVFGPKLKL